MALARVYISFSERDADWRDRLREQLDVLQAQGHFEVWDQRSIESGDDWRPALEQALGAAHVAILLISASFLTSRVGRDADLPRLLQRREGEGLRVLPVLVRPCPVDGVAWLERMLPPNRRRVLARLSDVDADSALVEVAETVARWTREARPASPGGASGVPATPAIASQAGATSSSTATPPHKTTGLPPTDSAEAQPDSARATSVVTASAVPAWPAPQAPASLAQRREFEFETVTLDRHGRELVARRDKAVGWAEPLAEGVALEMIELPGARYERGAADGEADAEEAERPQHAVRVAVFAIGRFAIRQAQWRVVAGWRKIKLALDADPADFKGDERPVERVSWHDAVEFCARLSARTGRRYRLPSEAEWEYAARAGTTRPFAFGETITPAIVNYDGNYPYAEAPKGRYREGTTPVGHLRVVNAFGLFDMHGNVWEWCQDPWHGSYCGAPSDARVWDQGGDTAYRVLRGGSWGHLARRCRSAYRYRYAPDDRARTLGVRVVCEVART